MQKLILLSDITLSNSLRVRSVIDQNVVEEYYEAMVNKDVFPAIELFQTNKTTLLLVDGWHRFYAARKANIKKILANIHDGDESEALRFALHCNARHGLRRSNADKRRCVTLAMEKWPDISNRALADLCGVTHTFINKLKAVLDALPEKKDEPPEEPEKPTNHEPTVKKPDEPVILLDKTGCRIPEKAVAIWNRKPEAEHVLSFIDAVKDEMEAVKDSKDPLWSEVAFNSVMADLDRLRTALSCAVPYAVCTTCQGQLPESCTFCTGRGMISKWRWDYAVPEDVKKLRKGDKC